MRIEGEGKLLRIFIGESDRWQGMPLYEAIVRRVREAGLAGATVLRGIEGYGAHSRIHTARILRLSADLPIVIEIVDREDRIDAILPSLDEMIGEGLITIEKVHVVRYRPGQAPEGTAGSEATPGPEPTAGSEGTAGSGDAAASDPGR